MKEHGTTTETTTGWAVSFLSSGLSTKVYLKKNSNINLGGTKGTGKNSIQYTKYVNEVD